MVILSKNHKVDYDKMFQVLKDTKEIMDSIGIKWCVFGGTLLGAYRDKDFCKGDFDIDIFIMDVDPVRKLTVIFHKYGLKTYDLMAATNPMTVSLGEEWCDIYLMSSATDSTPYLICSQFPFHKKFFTDFPMGEIRGLKVPIVNHTEEFLELYYGSNWRIPDPKCCAQFIDNPKLQLVLEGRKRKGI